MKTFSQLAAGLGLLAAIAASQSQLGAGAAGFVALGAASISSPAFAQNQPCNDNGTHCSMVKAYNRTNVTRCFRFYLPTGTRQFTPADGTHMDLGGLHPGTRFTYSIFGATCGGAAWSTRTYTVAAVDGQRLEIFETPE
ncbi:hypothetical protein CDO26_09145 [Sinorhizobium meliloti]|nr:hypothetical protein CDO26_09145 [Sinorhizobium meliloti]